MSRLSLLRRFRFDTLDNLAADCARLVGLLIDELAGIQQGAAPKLTFANETVVATSARYVLKLWTVPRIDPTGGTTTVYFPSLTAKDAGVMAGGIKVVSGGTVTYSSLDGSLVNSLTITSSGITGRGLTLFVWDGRAWWQLRG